MAWGEERVYFYDEDAQLQQLPASWTDIVELSPFVVVARGRAHFCPTDLLELADLLDKMEGLASCET
jgi:hypothetical protein